MTNYPIYLGTLAVATIILFLLLKCIAKKYRFLKNGFRSRATVIKIAEHHGNRMTEFGYVPVVQFMAHNGQMRVVRTDFFLERFVSNPKLEVGYEFDIVYQKDDLKGMMEISTLKGVIFTYSVIAVFPGVIILILIAGLFY